MLAGMGFFLGYDGHYEFDNIGGDYIKENVPYIGLRALPAALGALTVPFVYLIMRHSGFTKAAASVAALFTVFGLCSTPQIAVRMKKRDLLDFIDHFRSPNHLIKLSMSHHHVRVRLWQRNTDNSLVAQTRLILLDSMLMFFMFISIYCYVRFYKLRHR